MVINEWVRKSRYQSVSRIKFNCVVYINMKKQYTIDEFFKRKHSSSTQDSENPLEIILDEDTPMPNFPITENRFKKNHVENNEIELSTLERDPGFCKQIYDYPGNQRDAIICRYINHGSFQQTLSVYPKSDGFQNWKEVGGKSCAFLHHIGIECTSFHNVAQKSCDDLLNEAHDIRNVFETFKEEELRLKATIYTVGICAFQGIAYRGHDEGSDSINKILNLISTRVRRLMEENFCLVVVEAHGFIKVRFFRLVHVTGTTSQTLKNAIYFSICGQGYDGASNMRGYFKGLQALISNDSPYAYYVHCFAHRLQLALMAASQGAIALQKFFTRLSFVINVVGASSKRTDQLRDAQAEEIAYRISIDKLETGRGLNQISTLQRADDTRWSSHLKSVSRLIKMLCPTCEVLLKIIKDVTGPIKGGAYSTYESITTFEFIFVLHLEQEIMEITDLLCQSLQRKSQDICNALRLVASTKFLLQKMKDERWDMRNELSDHTLEHHYRVDIFYEAINCQLIELNHRFSDRSIKLLRLLTTLDPKSVDEPFQSGDVIKLVENFNEQEKLVLRIQLQHYEIDVIQHAHYELLTSILILTLLVSAATTERSFSATNLIKTRLQNRIEDEFLNEIGFALRAGTC
uniref:Zinc finger MYM-type protein 1-like n=1 Tax=Lactuca sativa TaxID=4236 RepID=A0A9R1WQU4_LACSA|nr:hypothetical protein LSAT_V11C900487420 [Lactuca sativa]